MNDLVINIIAKLAPVFILIVTGIILRITRLIHENSIDDLKKLIINLSLPSILFFSFLGLDLKISYLFIFITIFLLCIVLYLSGIFINRIFKFQNPYIPFMMTGFEFGMMGAVFFGAAFGVENMAFIGIIALGHEFFIWFVYVTLLKKRPDIEQHSLVKSLVKLVTSPIIIAITAGIIFNILGLKSFLDSFSISQSLFQSMKYLAGLTIPLILLIIGYSIKFDFIMLKNSYPVILLRLLLVFLLGIAIDFFLIKKLLHLDNLFSAALFTFIILPPPFILPLYINKEESGNIQQINGILLLYSFISIVLFSIYFIIYSAGIL